MTAAPLGGYGRAVEAGDGMLHVEGRDGQTLCGREVACYPLRWDLQSVVACGSCLAAAGVPLRPVVSAGVPVGRDDARRGPAGA